MELKMGVATLFLGKQAHFLAFVDSLTPVAHL